MARIRTGEKRQRAATEAYTKISGYEIAETFYDAAVSGADPVSGRSRLRRDARTPDEQRRADHHSGKFRPLILVGMYLKTGSETDKEQAELSRCHAVDGVRRVFRPVG
jgi:hypothetical protein